MYTQCTPPIRQTKNIPLCILLKKQSEKQTTNTSILMILTHCVNLIKKRCFLIYCDIKYITITIRDLLKSLLLLLLLLGISQTYFSSFEGINTALPFILFSVFIGLGGGGGGGGGAGCFKWKLTLSRPKPLLGQGYHTRTHTQVQGQGQEQAQVCASTGA